MEKVNTNIGMVNRFQYIELQKENPHFKNVEYFGKSTTVPNQSMSVRDMISKYMTVNNMPVSQQSYYDSEKGIEEYDPTMDRNFDLADYSMMSAELKDDYERLQADKADAERSEEEAKKVANLNESSLTDTNVSEKTVEPKNEA